MYMGFFIFKYTKVYNKSKKVGICMREITSVNIDNTYRSANLNVLIKDSNKRKVVDVNRMKESKKINSNYVYHVTYNRRINDNLVYDLIEHNCRLDYHTKTVVPFPTLLNMHNNKNSEAIYDYHGKWEQREIENMNQASMLCRTAVEVKIKAGITNPYALLYNLWDTRYLVDRVIFNFELMSKKEYTMLPENTKKYYEFNEDLQKYQATPEGKESYYTKVHEILARWQLQLWIMCEDEVDANETYTQGIALSDVINTYYSVPKRAQQMGV